MDSSGKRKLRNWLQKSLQNHPENDNGLVAYVEAIVGNAQGTDEDLIEKWTDKLDDFLAENSTDFANRLLRGVRSGNYGQIWRGGGDSGDGDVHDETDSTDAQPEAGRSQAEPEFREEQLEDAVDEALGEDDWDDGGRNGSDAFKDDDDDDDDDDDESRSRRRRRGREEDDELAESETSATNEGGSGGPSGNKRQRLDTTSDQSRNDTGGRGGGQQQKNAGKGSKQGAGRGGNGTGSLATGQNAVRGRAPGEGPGQWGGRAPVGMPQGGFRPPGQQGPRGMMNFVGGPRGPMAPNGPMGGGGPMGLGGPMGPGGPIMGPMGPGRPMGPRGPMGISGPPGPGGPMGQGGPMVQVGPMRQGGPMDPGPGMSSGGPMQGRMGNGPGIGPRFNGPPGGGGGLLPTPTSKPGGFMLQQGRGRGPALLPAPPVMGPGEAPRQGMGLLAPQGGGGGPNGPAGPQGPAAGRGPGGPDGGRGLRGMSSSRDSGPSGGGRGGGPMIEGPSRGRSPSMGSIPGPQGFGGPARLGGPRGPRGPIRPAGLGGPSVPSGMDGNGSGTLRALQPDGRPGLQVHGEGRQGQPDVRHEPGGIFEGPNTRQGPEVFEGPAVRPSQGPGQGQGQGQGMRQGLYDRQHGSVIHPGADNNRGFGMQGSGMEGRGQYGAEAQHAGANSHEGRELRLGPDVHQGPGLRDGPDTSGTGPGHGLPRRLNQREGLGVRQGQAGVQNSSNPIMNNNPNIGDIAKKNGRSVFERLGTPPIQEGGGGIGHGRNTLDTRELAQQAPNMRGRSLTDLPQQGPDARQGPSVTMRHIGQVARPPGMQQGMQQGQNGQPQRGQDAQHGGPNMGEGPSTRHPQEFRQSQDIWHGRGQEERPAQDQGRFDGAQERFDHGTAAGRSVGPSGIENKRDQVGIENHIDRRPPLRGGNIPSGVQRDGISREYSTRGPRPQAPQMHAGRDGGPQGSVRQGGMNMGGHPHDGSSQWPQHAPARPGMDAMDGGLPRDQSQMPSGVGMGSLAMGQARGQPSQPRTGVDAGPPDRNQSRSRAVFGHQGAGFSRGLAEHRGDDSRGGGIGRGVPPRGGGGALAWGGMGIIKDQTNNRSGGSGTGSRDAPGNIGSDRHEQGPGHGQRHGSHDGSHVSEGDRPVLGGGRGGQGGPRAQQGDFNHNGNNAGMGGRGWGPGQRPREERGSFGGDVRSVGRAEELHPSERVTVRVCKIPNDVGPVELSQHFVEFGKVVDVRMRMVRGEEGSNGPKEALLQFASARQAKACISSPKAVLGNRFIVVEMSNVNLQDVDHNYVDNGKEDRETRAAQLPSASQQAAAKAAEEASTAAAMKKAEAAAAYATQKAAYEKVIAQASKTREVVAQQRLLILLQERVKVATEPLAATRAKRDKVHGFLKMMEQKGRPEEEKTRYRKMYESLAGKVSALEAAAQTDEVVKQARKLAELEAEARAMGAKVPPPPNAANLARLMAGARGAGGDAAAGGRGYVRGRGVPAPTFGVPGRGSGGGGEQTRVAFSLDNRPTTVKVSGLPSTAGEGDLRVHANMAGVVVAAAMTGRPGEGLVKFADRWTAETFMSKSKSFGGIPLTMAWHTGPFPDQQEPGTGPATVPETASRTIQRTDQGRHRGGSPSTAAPAARRSPSPSPEAQYPASLKLASADPDLGRYGHVGTWGRHDDDTGEVGGPGWGEREGDEEKEGARSGDGDERAPGNMRPAAAAGMDSGGGGSAGSSPLRLPTIEGEDADEMYQDMQSWS